MHEITRIQKQIADLQKQKQAEINKLSKIYIKDLNKQELQDYAMTLPEIPDNLLLDMKEYGFQTGSSVYSNTKKPADIDWVCQLPARAFIQSNCVVLCSAVGANYIDNSINDFTPMYGNKDGILYNILCIANKDKFEAWKMATQILAQLNASHSNIAEANKTKWKRVRLFRALCDVLEEVKPLSTPSWVHKPTLEEVLKYHRCITCGREAVNFTCKKARDHYQATGVCERCNP